MNTDTIVAIATANGYAGIGIIRISGAMALSIAQSLSQQNTYQHKVSHICNFYDAENEIIDSGIIIYFCAPHSFTGEHIIEVQGHGSPIALQLLLKRIIHLGARHAMPGEFSQRAYINGKIDLVQAESIMDLIHAESEASVKGAMKSLQGKFSQQINEVNQQLINSRMFVEAAIDFPEEDIEFITNAKIYSKLEGLIDTLQQLLHNTKQGALLNNGVNIIIIGQANVGKSSLINTLANEDVAIVTDIPGTTRDIVKQKIIINGIACNILDTAGIRQTSNKIEQIGIERTFNAINSATLCIVVIDVTIGITTNDLAILKKIPQTMPIIFVHNKIDLLNDTQLQ